MVGFPGTNFPGDFTVLMAVYVGDMPTLFERAVHSVFKNTLLPKEFLLVIDGPINDGLEASVKSLVKSYVRQFKVVRLDQNQGLAKALNFALNHISTAWVVRADADDINLDHRFATLAKMVQDYPSLDLVGSAILEVDESGVQLAKRVMPTNKGDIKVFARRRNPFNHMTVAFRLDKIQSVGAYPNIYLKEDYGLWCRCLAADIAMANSDEVLVWATTGIAMYQRRGGWRHVQSEYDLQKLMINLKLKTVWQAFYDGSLRAIFFIIPARLREFFYAKMFRNTIIEN